MNTQRFLHGWVTVFLTVWAFVLTGCMAQQADVVRIKKDLDARVSQLDNSRKELRTAVVEANQAVQKAQTIIAQQRSEIQDLLRARADLLDQMTTIRDGDLSQVRGELEKQGYALQVVTGQVEDVRQHLDAIREETGSRVSHNATAIQHLTGQVQQQGESMAVHQRQDEEFRDSLLEFKQVLTVLRQNLESQEAGRQVIASQVERFAQQTNKESTQVAGYLNEVKHSVGSVVKALEETSANLSRRLDEQEQRLGRLDTHLQRSGVSPQEFQAQAQYIEELRQSQGRLQSALDVVVKTLGARVDSHEAQLARLLHGADSQVGKASVQPIKVPTSGSHASMRPLDVDPQVTRSFASGPSDVQAYQRVQQKIHERNYQGALMGFSDFLKRYPSSSLAGNAQYWMGECFYAMRKFPQAIQEFERVVYHYPTSKKVPAALLKIGYAHLEMRDRPLAKATFQQLVRSFTDSPEAAKANARLMAMQ